MCLLQHNNNHNSFAHGTHSQNIPKHTTKRFRNLGCPSILPSAIKQTKRQRKTPTKSKFRLSLHTMLFRHNVPTVSKMRKRFCPSRVQQCFLDVASLHRPGRERAFVARDPAILPAKVSCDRHFFQEKTQSHGTNNL